MPNKTMIIAEAGVNHNGSIEMALQLVDAAAKAGADAVKFQNFRASALVSGHAPKACYQQQTTDKQESQLRMLEKLQLSNQMTKTIAKHCQLQAIEFLSSPFDEESLDFLVKEIGVSTLKIPSGEVSNAPFLLHAARTGCKIILSTGMSTLGDVENALAVLAFGYLYPNKTPDFLACQRAYASDRAQRVLAEKVTLLHCTTEYPAAFTDVNLFAMNTLGQAFGLSVGYSDHTPGIHVPIAAVARGAAVIEKHFTLDRTLEGPDHRASLEPNELTQMIACIRDIELALGSQRKRVSEAEWGNRDIARKSIVASQSIRKGELFSVSNTTLKRPGTGRSPMQYWQLLHEVAQKDYIVDELVD